MKNEARNDGKKNGKRKSGFVTRLVMVVCLAGFLVCAGIVIAGQVGKATRADSMQRLQETATQETQQSVQEISSVVEELGIDIPEKNLDFNELAKTNKDIYAWITVPGTEIDYPVLQHPSDDSYYLEHNIDGSSGLPGCIYSELLNGTSFNDRNTVLYGHNMKNGTMFATLHRYADSTFFNENKYIFIYTRDGRTLVYRIFAAHTYSDTHLLKGIDITSDDKFQDYLDSIYESRAMGDNLAEDVTVTYEDRIITLSTCTGDDSKRFLVQGVLVNG
jgi:sortase B